MARIMGTLATRPNRKLGDRGFEVEWCCKSYVDPETGDGNPDNDEYARRFVRTLDEALVQAKEVYPHAQQGIVTVTEVEWTDPYEEGIERTFHWEHVGESKCYSGDEGFEN